VHYRVGTPSEERPTIVLFRSPSLDRSELAVVDLVDAARSQLGLVLGQPERWVAQLRQATLARNIQASNAMEGMYVELDDVAAAVEGRAPSSAAGGAWAAVTDYRDAMTYILQLATDPHFRHDHRLLRALHFIMTRHDLAATPGLYRTGSVFVWSSESGGRVYDAPPAGDVPGLVEQLVDELNDHTDLPVVVRAGMAHLNLTMIHPFRDGNGRMARALQTLVLARDQVPWPELTSIEEYLGANAPRYHRVLSQVGGRSWQPGSDARPWVRFVLTAHHRQATVALRRARQAERLWTALEEASHRAEFDQRALMTLHRAALGWRIERADHAARAGVSSRTARAELRRLVESGLLEARGEQRTRYYRAGPELLRLRTEVSDPPSPIPDPFAP
jgi:Fic family protein